MESRREMLEKLAKLKKLVDSKNVSLEKFQKLLDAKKETCRRKKLSGIYLQLARAKSGFLQH
jgi:hypothetical protein